jgi:hypothetical protein
MQVSFAFLTGLALAAWWAVFVTILIKTRRRIDAPAAPADVAMIEAPAVAALLHSAKGVVPDDAARATFLDLAARGMFRFEHDPQGKIRVVGAQPDPALRRYERLVYDHAVKRMSNTPSLAAEDLLQLERHLQSEMQSFRDAVRADARGRGLVRDRAPRMVRVVLWLALLVPAVCALSALAQSDEPFFRDYAIYIVLIGYRIATLPVRVLRRAAPTPAGARLAAAYRTLQKDIALTADAHPPGDRLAAYAEALGVASADRAIWSTTSGRWRRVRIVNPFGLVGWLIVPLGASAFVSVLSTLPAFALGAPSLALILFCVFGVSVFGIQLGFGLVWTYEKVSGRAHAATGRVVYLRGNDDADSFCVALDDGQSAQAEVLTIEWDLFERLHYGDWLTLEVTPLLREIRDAGIVAAP